MSSEEKLSLEQVDKVEPVIRELIRHENDVVHQRLTWLIQSQGLLFTALAFAWEKEPRFALMLSILGIATSLSIWSAISLYSPAVRGLYDWWETNVPDEYKKGRLVMGSWSPSKGVPRIFRPWRALPFIFIVAWLGVLGLKLT
ncbi:MAG: hypothetical protein U1E83_02175 [Methylotetracoccus sp.]